MNPTITLILLLPLVIAYTVLSDDFYAENPNLIILKNDTCMPLIDLEPKIVFNYFCGITKTPRPSGKLHLITKYLEEFATKHYFEFKKDEIGNILVKVPASRGFENSKSLCLQSHIDMVAEKDEAHKDFDFDSQPIQLILDEGWLRANGTTLGGDNGLGMSLALSVATDPTIKHGPLELLFTVDEEVGLIGATGLQKGFVNSHHVLNLDGSFSPIIIGCAGGKTTTGTLNYKTETSSGPTLGITIEGLRGGHSGVDITKQRANSIKLLARILLELIVQHVDFKLVSLEGGGADNAIPRYAHAFIRVHDVKKVQDIVSTIAENAKIEYALSDPSIKISTQNVEGIDDNIVHDDAIKMILTLNALPHGCTVLNLEQGHNKARTSTNLASIKTADGVFTVLTSQRSDYDSERDEITNNVISVFKLAKFEQVKVDGVYPGWIPNLNSALSKTAQQVFKTLFNKDVELTTIHGGLEAGIITTKIDDEYNADAISFGVHVDDAHSPTEKFRVADLEPAYNFIKALVDALK
ncbi:cytosol non-specific dipeptidase pepD [Acrasis kona]|uniref:Cytosol non-specific dipeptidase pepD n=1 Tax=Acrasis kona TaxID=1008807 RepID=A0AAW2Z5R1_9EUKA